MLTSGTTSSSIRPLPAGKRKPLALRILDALAACDARYREAQKLKRMPQHRLDDMGIPARGASRRGR